MALTAAQKTRIGQLYRAAVHGCKSQIPISQSDLRALLLANDAGDPIASVISPSINEIYKYAGESGI